MKIELLNTFLEVSRTLHFRLAAESLYITQSAVSARIKLLEDELGVLLFDRSQKNLKLTPEGHRLIRHANELIFMWQKTKQDVGIMHNESQQLVVASMMSIWDIVLQNWLQKIDRNIEDLSLLTSTNSPLGLRKQVLNRITDIAFLFEPPFVEELVTQKVATVPLHLVSTQPHENSQVVNLDKYVMVDYGESVNTQYQRDFKDTPPAKHFMSQPRIALDFILGAGGCAYLPRQLTFEYIQSHQLYIVAHAPVYYREIFAIYLANSQKKDLIQQVIDLFPYVEV